MSRVVPPFRRGTRNGPQASSVSTEETLKVLDNSTNTVCSLDLRRSRFTLTFRYFCRSTRKMGKNLIFGGSTHFSPRVLQPVRTHTEGTHTLQWRHRQPWHRRRDRGEGPRSGVSVVSQITVRVVTGKRMNPFSELNFFIYNFICISFHVFSIHCRITY